MTQNLGSVVLTLCSSYHFSYAECRGWIYYELIFMQLLTTLVEVILVVRCMYFICLLRAQSLIGTAVYVLYSRGWFITIVLSVSFVCETVAMVTTLALVSDKITFLPSCLITDIPDTFAGFWYVLSFTLLTKHSSWPGSGCPHSFLKQFSSF